MSWVDVALLIAAVVALGAGLYTGFLRLVLAAAGLGAGLWVAWRYAPDLAASLGGTPGSARVAFAICFAVLVLVTVGAAALLTWLLSRTLKVFRLGWADRTAGGLLALAGFTALAAVFSLSFGVDKSPTTSPAGSRLLPLIAREARTVGERLGLSPLAMPAPLVLEIEPPVPSGAQR